MSQSNTTSDPLPVLAPKAPEKEVEQEKVIKATETVAEKDRNKEKDESPLSNSGIVIRVELPVEPSKPSAPESALIEKPTGEHGAGINPKAKLGKSSSNLVKQ